MAHPMVVKKVHSRAPLMGSYLVYLMASCLEYPTAEMKADLIQMEADLVQMLDS